MYINCGGQATTVLTPARLICDRAPSSNRWVITLPIDAFFPLDPELAEECDVMKPEAFRPGSSTSAHQASKTESKASTDRNGFKRARWQGLLKQSMQDC